MASNDEVLHIAVLPWLAAGHITPFLELSTRIALLGHRISFLSTPANLTRIDTDGLPSHFHLVPLTPSVHVPVSSTSELTESTEHLRPLLRRAYDSLSAPLTDFLSSADHPPVDWLLCDYAPYWAMPIAKSLNVRTAFISASCACSMAFFGPPDDLINPSRLRPEDLTVLPDWITVPTKVVLRPHEARVCMFAYRTDESGLSEAGRFGLTIKECDIVAFRSSYELEPEWLPFLEKLYGKPVLPLGHFPPEPKESSRNSAEWAHAFGWLDSRAHGSVVYVAFGSEVRLTKDQIQEIARGLELSGLPFVWALMWPSALEEVLPDGFLGRTSGQGIVCHGWVPQAKFLGHPAMGGFVTHCGWSSVTEGLQFGLVLILVPMIFDQGINARLLEEKLVGKEVPRNEDDGAFDGIGISETLKLVMVEEEGKIYRNTSREFKNLVGNKEMQHSYVMKFVDYLKSHRPE